MPVYSFRKELNYPRLLILSSLIFLFTMTGFSPARAVEPATAVRSAQMAEQAVGPAIGTLKAVADVPFAAAEVLKLPLGAVQTALFPLPGASLSSGLSNIGSGLTAPFKLAGSVLTLPSKVISQAGKIGSQ